MTMKLIREKGRRTQRTGPAAFSAEQGNRGLTGKGRPGNAAEIIPVIQHFPVIEVIIAAYQVPGYRPYPGTGYPSLRTGAYAAYARSYARENRDFVTDLRTFASASLKTES